MHVRTTRRPGEPGTRKLVAKYGGKLVELRYCYDAAKANAIKPSNSSLLRKTGFRHRDNEEDRVPTPAPTYSPRVPVRIQYFEKDLQRQLKAFMTARQRLKSAWCPAGHWEGDLIKGAYNRSAVGTLVPHPALIPAARALRGDAGKTSAAGIKMPRTAVYT